MTGSLAYKRTGKELVHTCMSALLAPCHGYITLDVHIMLTWTAYYYGLEYYLGSYLG